MRKGIISLLLIISLVVSSACFSEEVVSNVVDGNGMVRTFYFNIEANASRSVVIDQLGASADNWGSPDGYWGSPDGLDTSNITMMNLYLWEDAEVTGDSFIIDNIVIK